MSFDVWRTLKLATTELRLTAGKQNVRFMAYSCYSWLMPLVFVALAIGVDLTNVLPEEFTPGFGNHNCWFSHRSALLVFFAAPLGAVMVANIILFLCSAKIIYDTTSDSASYSSCAPRVNFKLYGRLAVIMGLTWIVGLVAGYLDQVLEPDSIMFNLLWYAFIILNALQGLFIFVAFTCTSKVTNELYERLFSRRSSDTRRPLFSSKKSSQKESNYQHNFSSLSDSSLSNTKLTNVSESSP